MGIWTEIITDSTRSLAGTIKGMGELNLYNIKQPALPPFPPPHFSRTNGISSNISALVLIEPLTLPPGHV